LPALGLKPVGNRPLQRPKWLPGANRRADPRWQWLAIDRSAWPEIAAVIKLCCHRRRPMRVKLPPAGPIRGAIWQTTAIQKLRTPAGCGVQRRMQPAQDSERTGMPIKDDQHHRAARCALCDGNFGLIRHYCCRTALCSRKCVEHFKLRRDGDSHWLWRFRAAEDRSRRNAAISWQSFPDRELTC
jgi:hypothetical protein